MYTGHREKGGQKRTTALSHSLLNQGSHGQTAWGPQHSDLLSFVGFTGFSFPPTDFCRCQRTMGRKRRVCVSCCATVCGPSDHSARFKAQSSRRNFHSPPQKRNAPLCSALEQESTCPPSSKQALYVEKVCERVHTAPNLSCITWMQTPNHAHPLIHSCGRQTTYRCLYVGTLCVTA